MKPVIIISTFPDKKSIDKTAQNVINKRLAACVNVLQISSIYTWKGKIENTPEYLALFKTTEKNKNLLRKEIKNSHPYDVPEIAEIDVPSINEPYLKWLVDSTI